MSQSVTLRLVQVALNNREETVEVTRIVPEVVIAGISGAAGPTWAGKFGGFYEPADQTLNTVDTPQKVSITGSYGSTGITLSNSQIIFPTPGVYQMTMILSLNNISQNMEDVSFWLKLNGNNYANSTVHLDVPARKSNNTPSELPITITFVGTASTPNDYVEIWWLGSSTDVTLSHEPESISPAYPAAPSVIVSVIQIA